MSLSIVKCNNLFQQKKIIFYFLTRLKNINQINLENIYSKIIEKLPRIFIYIRSLRCLFSILNKIILTDNSRLSGIKRINYKTLHIAT